jgi:hypothetical protein
MLHSQHPLTRHRLGLDLTTGPTSLDLTVSCWLLKLYCFRKLLFFFSFSGARYITYSPFLVWWMYESASEGLTQVDEWEEPDL